MAASGTPLGYEYVFVDLLLQAVFPGGQEVAVVGRVIAMAVSTPHSKTTSPALGVDKRALRLAASQVPKEDLVPQSPLQPEGEGVWLVWATGTPGCSLGP